MSDEATKALMRTAGDYYALPAFVTLLSASQQGRFAKRVGLARGRYGVKVPETEGDPAFVRVFRAHQNCTEFFPLYLTSLWMSSIYFHPVPASLCGVLYMVGRQKYFDGYSESADQRLPGFKLSKNALFIMLGMSGVGITFALLRRFGASDTDIVEVVCGSVRKACIRS